LLKKDLTNSTAVGFFAGTSAGGAGGAGTAAGGGTETGAGGAGG